MLIYTSVRPMSWVRPAARRVRPTDGRWSGRWSLVRPDGRWSGPIYLLVHPMAVGQARRAAGLRGASGGRR